MFKQIGIILLVVCGVTVILTPVYKGLFNKDNKKDKFKEEEIIGTSYGHKKAEIYDEVMSYRLKSKSTAMQIQTALKNAGFYAGKIDGKIGPQTKRAIKAFQKSKGLAPDGIVGPKTWNELRNYL